jgi:hypothetical protein
LFFKKSLEMQEKTKFVIKITFGKAKKNGVVDNLLVHPVWLHLANQVLCHRPIRGPVPHPVGGILCSPRDEPKNRRENLPAVEKFDDFAHGDSICWKAGGLEALWLRA